MTTVQGSSSGRTEADAAENDHSDQLIGRLLSVIAGVGTVAGLSLGLLRLQSNGQADSGLALNIGFALTAAAALWLLRRGRLLPAANMLFWGGWCLNAAFICSRGGVHNVNWLTFPILISGAAWILGLRSTLAMTAACAALYIGAAQAEASGWFGRVPPYNVRVAEVYYSVIFGLCATISLLARKSYHQRIDRERMVSAALTVRDVELGKLSQVIEQSPQSTLITDLHGWIEYANPAARQRLQLDQLPERARNAWQLTAQAAGPLTVESIRAALDEGRSWHGEWRNLDDADQQRVEAARVSPLRQPDGSVLHHVWSLQDITAHRQAEARLKHVSLHDELTELPNRRQLELSLAELMADAPRPDQPMALLVLNVDRFKTVNEARGQAVGDALLRALAARLREVLTRRELLARLGADEFAVLLPALEGDATTAGHQAFALANLFHETLQLPLSLASEAGQITLTASVGIAIFTAGLPGGAGEVLRRATTALNQAKLRGGAQTAFFEAAMGDAAQRRFDIERDLREALLADQLRLFLQPQVDAQGRWAGAEALVRWQHPVQGMVSPGLFIPIAEETDLIVGLGEWVFTEAVRLIGVEARAGRALALSVNLSPRQFRQADFVPWLSALLERHRVDPGLLTLEITEGLVIGNVEETIERMKALRALGLHFSIDDFGTGYSSLAYLKRLPISELKIDKAFIQEAPTRADDAALVETILSVAKHMRLKVVAEGVETEAQGRFLAERAPEVILQGFHYGRPAPAEDWLARWRQDGALPEHRKTGTDRAISACA
jgi:diguanylate cyclase (GGDEF)-like protein/PAS domain S-box-containing protein